MASNSQISDRDLRKNVPGTNLLSGTGTQVPGYRCVHTTYICSPDNTGKKIPGGKNYCAPGSLVHT